MAFGFGFPPLMGNLTELQRAALGLPGGFSGAPSVGLPGMPSADFAGAQPAPLTIGAMPARPVNSGRNPFDFGQVESPGLVPLPPMRPSDDDLNAQPPTAYTGLPGTPRPTGGFRDASMSDDPAAPASAPLPRPAQPMPAPTAAPREMSGMEAWKAVGDSGVGGTLLGLASGLLSGGGAAGWAQGFANVQKNRQAQGLLDQHALETRLKIGKLSQEAAGRAGQRDYLIRSNRYTPEQVDGIMAAAAAGDNTALANAMNNLVPKDAAPKEAEPFTLGANQTRFDASGQPIARTGAAKPEGFDTESKLRGEFLNGVGTFSDVHDAYGRVISSVQTREDNPKSVSPAADIGLIFGFMKMLDPGSVVREGEYATAKNAAGLDDRLRNVYNKLIDGEFLTPAQRQSFVEQAQSLYGQSRKTAEGVAGRYRDLATQYGVDPERTVYLPTPLSAPTVGPSRQTGAPGPDAAGTAGRSPSTAAKPAKDAAARFNELRRTGLSEDRAYQKMFDEGY